MKIINASYDFIEEKNPLKKIEKIARVCYKSEDKICNGSDVRMVNALIKREHTAMLEHADICLELDKDTYNILWSISRHISQNINANKQSQRCYLRFTRLISDYSVNNDTPSVTDYNLYIINDVKVIRHIVSGNFRAWYEMLKNALSSCNIIPIELLNVLINVSGGKENGAFSCFNDIINNNKYVRIVNNPLVHIISTQEDYSNLTDEERLIHETVTVKFTVDRGITHELVRMRECSFAQESTRYCNYSKDGFGKNVTFIKPFFWDTAKEENCDKYKLWLDSMQQSEEAYFNLLNSGATPQEARSVLPTSVKTDIVVTANLREWQHVLALRACDVTGRSHPQMHEVMKPLLSDMLNRYNFAFSYLVN